MKKIRVEGFNSTQLQQTYKELSAMRSVNSYEELQNRLETKPNKPHCVSLRLFLESRSSPVFPKRGAFVGVMT